VIIISYVLITYIFYYLKYLFLFKQNQVKESRPREKKIFIQFQVNSKVNEVLLLKIQDKHT